MILSNRYDLSGRRLNVALRNSDDTVLYSLDQTYASASRLGTVSDATNSAAYEYLAYSPLVGQITFARNGQTVMTTSNQYDLLNRLTRTESRAPQAAALSAYAYEYNPVALDLTTLAVLRQGTNGDLAVTNSGRLLVPRTPEEFIHDGDGTLTQDGLWNYTWDAENRLVRMVSRSEVPESSRQSLSFRYDDQGRRISKSVSNWVTGQWSLVTDHRFVYDGWNLLAVLNSNLEPLLTLAWGLDLSGTPQGAGGVGGLLWVSSHLVPGSSHFAAYDANGNVTALVNSSDGVVSARYEYGPFGEPLRVSGPMGTLNPLRFSTKYHDQEAQLLYYGYRYYNPSSGTWLSRDPIGEEGGPNLYGLVGNLPTSRFDCLGLTASASATTVSDIPGIMNANGWCNGAALMLRWFSLPAGVRNPPDTTTITMSCVKGYARAKAAYDNFFLWRHHLYDDAKADIIRNHGKRLGKFGDFTQPFPELDRKRVFIFGVDFTPIHDPADDLAAALGRFEFRVLVKGFACPTAIVVTHVGLYAKDDYNFEGHQLLGFWNKTTNYGGYDPTRGDLVTNGDFRDYATRTGMGGDYKVYSDVEETKLDQRVVIWR